MWCSATDEGLLVFVSRYVARHVVGLGFGAVYIQLPTLFFVVISRTDDSRFLYTTCQSHRSSYNPNN